MKCVKCYRDIADGLKFCTKCGAKQPEDRKAYEREHPELAYTQPEEEDITDMFQQTAYAPGVAMSRDDFMRFVEADPQRDTIIQMVDEGVSLFGFSEKAAAEKWYSKCAELIDDKLAFYPFFVKLLSQQYEKARNLLLSQAAEGLGIAALVKQEGSKQNKSSVSAGRWPSASPQKPVAFQKSAHPVTTPKGVPPKSTNQKFRPTPSHNSSSKPRKSSQWKIVAFTIVLAGVLIAGLVLFSKRCGNDAGSESYNDSTINVHNDNIEAEVVELEEGASFEGIKNVDDSPEGNSIVSNSGERVFCAGDILFSMMPVEGGTFIMGATREQAGDANDDEKPTHSVTLSSYYIGQTEVTQELWLAVMGDNPSKYRGAKRPVDNVSWENCQEFLRKLNEMTGMRFRLPTEAEWEFAARGGNKSRGYKYSGGNNIGEVAWYHDNSGGTSHNVGTKRPNELGLYDMSGNVCEWCSDWYGDYDSSSQSNPQGPYSGSTRAFRGGTWYYLAKYCRVSYRHNLVPGHRYYLRGLRLAL